MSCIRPLEREKPFVAYEIRTADSMAIVTFIGISSIAFDYSLLHWRRVLVHQSIIFRILCELFLHWDRDGLEANRFESIVSVTTNDTLLFAIASPFILGLSHHGEESSHRNRQTGKFLSSWSWRPDIWGITVFFISFQWLWIHISKSVLNRRGRISLSLLHPSNFPWLRRFSIVIQSTGGFCKRNTQVLFDIWFF